MGGSGARAVSFGGLFLMMALALAMGVPWEDALRVGQLRGTKTVLNEFLAYEQMKGLIARLGLRAIVSGTLAAFMTACFAGMLT